MSDDEILVVKKKSFKDKLKFKTVRKAKNRWEPSKYEKIIPGKDYNLLAYLFFDLDRMGYNVRKAYQKFKELSSEPDLFFLK